MFPHFAFMFKETKKICQVNELDKPQESSRNTMFIQELLHTGGYKCDKDKDLGSKDSQCINCINGNGQVLRQLLYLL